MEIKESLESQNYHEILNLAKCNYLCMCIYTPNGKREDLWDTHVKRPKVFKYLSAYISISLMLYLSICQEC